MPDPGYGPNGEWLAPVGEISWEANPPPTPVTFADDVFLVFPLGLQTIPFIDEDDDEVWSSIYLGGV